MGASVTDAYKRLELEMALCDYARQVAERDVCECKPNYSHDRQALYAHPYPQRYWCEDYKARLRWRVAPHPIHGRCYVLRPCVGLLHLNPENDAGTYVMPGHVATLQVY